MKNSKENYGLITILTSGIACLLIGIEFFRHFTFNNNAPIENWVATATYLNNAFSPVLLFASIFLLYRTWKDSKEALEVQKIELKETRVVLKEQSDIQSFSIVKEALLQVIDHVDELNEKEFLFRNDGKKWNLYAKDYFNFHNIKLEKNEGTMPFSVFLYTYFLGMSSSKSQSDELHLSFKNLIFQDSFAYIEKIKTIALLLKSIENNQYKPVLDITIFNMLSIWSWLFFVEISHHLLINAENKEKDEAELVFLEIAGLTCRQLKEVNWLDSLSDKTLVELRKRELI